VKSAASHRYTGGLASGGLNQGGRMTKVLIGCPVRDRGWVIHRHLEALKKIRVPEGVEVEFLYVLNDSTDNTKDILEQYGVPYVEYNTGREGYTRQKYNPANYGHLAEIRNYFIDRFLETDADYLFSIDSDIIVPEEALEVLLADDKDIISMILCNQPGDMPRRAHNVMNEDPSGMMVHILSYPLEQVFPCDLTGACYLIKREVLQAGVRYAQDPQGEDIPFCRQAKRLGFGIFCDSRVKPIHVMYPGVELIAGYTP
jgi:cellulose synthase/poly-beta-1,6-N-acetylglucosamine synthase-like glycosyltransferase